ncbi:GroES-like protein [Suillus cothurnatus]|nr:GroES-like protein [Suillus cothurnatus]
MQAAANTIQSHVGKLPTVGQPEYKRQPNDVIVKVTGTTICGSDLHLYHGEMMPFRRAIFWPRVLTCLGVVDRTGPNIKNLTIGQRVVASFQIACGKCPYCKEGLSSFCYNTNNSTFVACSCFIDILFGLHIYAYGTRDAGFFGYSHFPGGFPGGQAEYSTFFEAISNDVSDEEALYLSDVLPTSYHCVVGAGVQEGDTVGIWGLGPIGQCCARWAKLKGASRIIAIGQVPERLERAKERGCEVVNLSMVKDVSQKVHEVVPGGLDAANGMIVSVRKIGRCVLFAAYTIISALMEKGAKFTGNNQAPIHKYWREILFDYIIKGRFDPKL